MTERGKAAEADVKKYNDGPRDKCPYCHNDLEAYWDTDDENRIEFFLECTGCTMRLEGISMEEIYAQLDGKSMADMCGMDLKKTYARP